MGSAQAGGDGRRSSRRTGDADLPPLLTAAFAAGGEMGQRLRGFDWSGTPLGPPDSWSSALCHAVDMVLASRARIALFWGEDHPFLVDRPGFLEQAYFDVAYDPIRDVFYLPDEAGGLSLAGCSGVDPSAVAGEPPAVLTAVAAGDGTATDDTATVDVAALLGAVPADAAEGALVLPVTATNEAAGAVAAELNRFAMRLPADPTRLSALRQRLEGFLIAHRVGETDLFDLTVAISEAAANAIEHPVSPAEPTIGVEVTIEDRTVVATVRDSGQWREPTGAGFRGRGLALIKALGELSVSRTGDGTEVTLRRRLQS